MADYTYATADKRKKAYEDTLAQEETRATQRANAFAAQANEANEQYKAGMDAAYDTAIQSQTETANKEADTTARSYRSQFDANAAQQMAAERHLKEQMANMGLTQSGYNATNQTALQLSRANADAQTRTAKQQAVDAIMQGLQEYKAEMEAQRAQGKAESNYTTQQSILQNRQNAMQTAQQTAADLYNQELTYDMDLQSAVESHNADIYSLMLSAYNSGNTALANEYAKDLWQINPDGTVGYKTLNTSSLSQPVSSPSYSSAGALGYPSIYEDYAEAAKKEAIEGNGISAADIVYDVVTQEGNPMTEDEIRQFCLESGVNYSYILNCVQLNTRPSQMQG